MLRFLLPCLASIAASSLLACSQASAPQSAPHANAPSPREALERVVEGYWDESAKLQTQGISSSPVARFEPAAGYDISAQFLADSLELERRYREALLAVPRASLSAESQLTYDIFRRERDLAVESFTYPFELMPVNPFRSLPLEFAAAGAGAGAYAILGAKDYDSWRARTQAYVRWTEQAVDNMREGLRRGYVLPRVLVERMLPMLAALGADVPSNVFYRPLAAFPASIRAEDRRRFSEGIKSGVKDQIMPAYRKLHDFLLDEYLPRARQSVGLSALPLGNSWYAYVVRRETASRLAPADIHAIGLAETERLRGRLQSLLAESGYAGTAQAFFEAVQREPRAPFDTPEAALDFYAALKVSAAAAISTSFAEAPQTDFLIRPVEPFRAGRGPALYYERAPNRGAAPLLYVDTAARPPIAHPAAFLREALPGHHLQLAVQQERSGLPRFRRFGGDPGFVEGWGLYAESLGEELGLYRDTEAKFESLRDELACAVALVVDTGLHGLGWSRERALDYVRAQVPIAAEEANERVDRMIALPGEALACGIGERAFRELRAHAQQVLGPRFDLRDFHAELIDDGAMPLDLLESAASLWLTSRH